MSSVIMPNNLSIYLNSINSFFNRLLVVHRVPQKADMLPKCYRNAFQIWVSQRKLATLDRPVDSRRNPRSLIGQPICFTDSEKAKVREVQVRGNENRKRKNSTKHT